MHKTFHSISLPNKTPKSVRLSAFSIVGFTHAEKPTQFEIGKGYKVKHKYNRNEYLVQVESIDSEWIEGGYWYQDVYQGTGCFEASMYEIIAELASTPFKSNKRNFR